MIEERQIVQSTSEPDFIDDTTRRIMEHLMFHRSLVDEKDDGSRMEHYISLLKGLDSSAAEPATAFDRGIIKVMRLAIDGQMDPWNIDLLEFSKMYLKQIKASDDIDLYTAGKITLMAWSILRMQSEEALQSAELKKAEEEYPFYGWDVESFQSFEPEEDTWSPQEDAPELPDSPPLRPRMRHSRQRSVTLIELAEAFGEAYMEAELNETVKKISRKPGKKREFRNPTHKEDPEADIRFTMERIKRFEAGPISLTDLYEPEGGKEELITLFSSLLFLAKEGKVHVWQNDLPYGEIYAELRVPFEIAKLEDEQPAREAIAAQIQFPERL